MNKSETQNLAQDTTVADSLSLRLPLPAGIDAAKAQAKTEAALKWVTPYGRLGPVATFVLPRRSR